jgi:hypothetical protein
MYCVTVTDANGCASTGCGTVNSFGCSLDVLLGPDAILCTGDTAVLSPAVNGASGSVTYVWTGGSTGSTLQITAGGEYCVTVTDASNCQDIDCITINEIAIPIFTCPVTNESAPGANDGIIECSGVPGIVSYLWSNGATTPSISGLAPGQYCVTVTDANGCTKSQCFDVQQAGCAMTVTWTQTNVICAGQSTGSITLSVNGATAPVTFAWSNGATGAVNNNLLAGTYSVTVTDAASCVLTQSIEITEPPAIIITIDTIAPVQDFDSGLIHITASGGVPPYIYLWTFPNGGSSNLEDLDNLDMPGNYTLAVTDAAGCIVSMDSIVVPLNVAVDPVEKFKVVRIYPVPAEDVVIIDMENPIEEAFISGLDGRLYKRITNLATNKLDVSYLTSGLYILRVTDGENWYIAKLIK